MRTTNIHRRVMVAVAGASTAVLMGLSTAPATAGTVETSSIEQFGPSGSAAPGSSGSQDHGQSGEQGVGQGAPSGGPQSDNQEGGPDKSMGRSPSDPDGDTNGGKDVPDGNNGSGNDADCEDDNNGRGVPAACKEQDDTDTDTVTVTDDTDTDQPVVTDPVKEDPEVLGEDRTDDGDEPAVEIDDKTGGDRANEPETEDKTKRDRRDEVTVLGIAADRGGVRTDVATVLPETGAGGGVSGLLLPGLMSTALGITLLRRGRRTSH